MMTSFDNSEFIKEAKARWGSTDAYKQFEEKTGARTDRDREAAAEGMDNIMEAFAGCMKTGAAPASAEAQALVKDLQNYITAHFYTCTDQILAGLGQMYVSNERFLQNIDSHGAGTAAFIRAAIGNYGKK